MIELAKIRDNQDGYFNIVIDRRTIPGAWAHKSDLTPGTPFQYVARNAKSSSALASQTIEDFEPFVTITLNNVFEWMKHGHAIILSPEVDDDENDENLSVEFYFAPDLAFWDMEFTFAEYLNEFNVNCESEFESNCFRFSIEDTPAFRLELSNQKLPLPIENLISPLETQLANIHKKSIENLDARLSTKLISVSFEFPDELRTSCKQYLVYFDKFLRDQSIDATSEVTDKEKKTLFSVTPKGESDALENIREALAIYLNLPSSPIVYDDSFRSMRLQQEIENLRHSQKMAAREIRSAEMELRLAQQIVEGQDRIISQKDSIIGQQEKIIEKITSESIMIDSLDPNEGLEEIFDGLKIGESKFLAEQFGVHLNPAKAIKTLGEKILGKKEENKSILRLDGKADSEQNKDQKSPSRDEIIRAFSYFEHRMLLAIQSCEPKLRFNRRYISDI